MPVYPYQTKKKHESARIREKFAEAWHRSIQKKYNENGM